MPDPLIHAKIVTKKSVLKEISELPEAEFKQRVKDTTLSREMKEAMKEALLGAFARERIIREWKKMGGASSAMGLPLDPSFPLFQRKDGGYAIQFRGGDLNAKNGDAQVRPSGGRHVVVRLEGYGLVVKQEAHGDDLYGTVAVQIPTTGVNNHITIPQKQLGPDDNDRIWKGPVILYEGPPIFINIMTSLNESDEGGGARKQARDFAASAADTVFDEVMQQVGEAVANDPTGEVAKKILAELKLEERARRWVEEGAKSLLDEIFGLGDDPYEMGILSISAAEMMNIPPLQQFKCWNDPKVLEFTHMVQIEGKDDGGDVGIITLCFSVKPA